MFESLPLFPERASTFAAEVDALYWAWIAISAFFSLLIAGAIFYFFIRYRRRDPYEMGERDKTSTALELTWSIIPLIIALVMFGWGTKVFFKLYHKPTDAVHYEATGKQWMWKFRHPTGKREINNLHVPVGQRVRIKMISEDTIHSLFIPAFRVKMDVLPGRYTELWFEPTKPGRYRLFCAEYCGTEHSLMGGWVTVMDPDDYEAWLGGDVPGQAGGDDTGRELFASLACDTCHREGDRARGPVLDGIYGSEVRLTSGRTVTADDDYLRQSILDPASSIVEGWDPVMPTFQGQVTEEQVLALIHYIKSLTAEADGEAAETAQAVGTIETDAAAATDASVAVSGG